jgi:ferredoxin, 2Fe-2S
MGGKNPYMASGEAPRPKKKYKITFLPMNVTVEVDPEKLPYGRDGQPGSILDIALAHKIDLDHSCGGVCACSTCHVIVRKGLPSVPPAEEDEEDMLEEAPGLTVESRLGCQAVPSGETDIVVEIPEWNRNLVKEGH